MMQLSDPRISRHEQAQHSHCTTSGASTKSTSPVGFVLFLLVNAVLFLRPTELIGEMDGVPIYEVAILACMVFSWKPLLAELRVGALISQPITVCVLGLCLAAPVSHLSHLYFGGALEAAKEFGKLVVYYLLLVSLVNSPRRLHLFLFVLAMFIGIVTVLAILQFHGMINLEALAPLADWGEDDDATGAKTIIFRMRGPGIFHDPNDLCLILVIGMAISLWRAAEPKQGIRRLGWIGVFGLFIYALTLTQSRGGFVSLLAACLALFWTRFGWRRALILGLLVAPVIFLVFGGRQTSISSTSETGQSRVRLWSDALTWFRESPIFGIGMNEFAEREKHVAHQSFLHAYGELGFFGGTLFLGAFYCAISGVCSMRQRLVGVAAPALARLCPYLVAVIVGYGTGLLALSRVYMLYTYLILGVANAFLQLTGNSVVGRIDRVDLNLFRRLLVLSSCFLLVAHLVVRSLAIWK